MCRTISIFTLIAISFVSGQNDLSILSTGINESINYSNFQEFASGKHEIYSIPHYNDDYLDLPIPASLYPDTNFTFLSNAFPTNTNSMCKANGHLYIGIGSYIHIYEIQNSGNLLLTGSVKTRFYFSDLDHDGEYLYASAHFGGIYIYEGTDYENPDLIGWNEMGLLQGVTRIHANGDSICIGSDITYLVNYFSNPEQYPIPIPGETYNMQADVNCDGGIIGSDITYLVNYFRGGLPPKCCYWLMPDTTVTYYMYSDGRVAVEYFAGEANGDICYVYGPNGKIASFNGGSGPYFYLTDHLGSTRMVVDGNRTPQSYFYYLPSGDFSPNKDSHESVETPGKFSGKEFDDEGEFELYYFGARYFDPLACQWRAVDPAGQFASPYSYTGGQLTYSVDPNGEFAWVAMAFLGAFVNPVIHRNAIEDGWDFAGFLAVGALGGFVSQFGGGTLIQNVLWGSLEGGFIGGFNNSIANGSGGFSQGFGNGMKWGAASAAAESGIEMTRNLIGGHGFQTNYGVVEDYIDDYHEHLSRGEYLDLEVTANDAIDFVQNRYGFGGVNMSYDHSLTDYGGTSLTTGNVRIGPSAFDSRSHLKLTVAHEWGHSVLDRIYDANTSTWSWVDNSGLYGADGSIGYRSEIINAGRLQATSLSLTESVITPWGPDYINPLWHDYKKFKWFEKWYYFIPRRY